MRSRSFGSRRPKSSCLASSSARCSGVIAATRSRRSWSVSVLGLGAAAPNSAKAASGTQAIKAENALGAIGDLLIENAAGFELAEKLDAVDVAIRFDVFDDRQILQQRAVFGIKPVERPAITGARRNHENRAQRQ